MKKYKIENIIIILPNGQQYRRVYTFLVAGMLIGLLKDHAIEYKVLDMEQDKPFSSYFNKNKNLVIFIYQWYDDLFFNSENRRLLTEYSSHSYVTAVGRAATVFYKTLLEHFAPFDFLMLGDVVDLIEGLLIFLSDPDVLNSTPPAGFATRNPYKGINYKPAAVTKINLDQTSLADRYYLERESRNKIAPIQMNKGCTGGCTFCIAKAFRKNSCTSSEKRFISPEKIFEEIEYVHSKYGVKYFSFCDDNFFNGQDGLNRAIRLADILIEKKLQIYYYIDARCDDLNEDLIVKLKNSGLRKICIGVESGSQSVLNRLNKQTSIEQIEKTIALLRKHHISFWLGFMMFEPRMSLKELKENFRFIENNLLYNDLSLERYAEDIIIAPGSILQEELKNQGLKLLPQSWIEEQFGDEVLPGLEFYAFENSSVALLRDYIKKIIRKTIRAKLILKRIKSFFFSKNDAALLFFKETQLTPSLIRECEYKIDDFFYSYIHSFVSELEEECEYGMSFFQNADIRYDLSLQRFIQDRLGNSIEEILNKLKF